MNLTEYTLKKGVRFPSQVFLSSPFDLPVNSYFIDCNRTTRRNPNFSIWKLCEGLQVRLVDSRAHRLGWHLPCLAYSQLRIPIALIIGLVTASSAIERLNRDTTGRLGRLVLHTQPVVQAVDRALKTLILLKPVPFIFEEEILMKIIRLYEMTHGSIAIFSRMLRVPEIQKKKKYLKCLLTSCNLFLLGCLSWSL